ncbi:MAG: GNAT family N-acetyltransferase [Candidatus Peregrinibacteria bacterium]
MIRDLHESDRQAILDYSYQREMENMFVIGSFNRPKTFELNRFIGIEEDGKLMGLATVFLNYASFVVHAAERSVIDQLVDAVMDRGLKFNTVPAFRRYAEPMIERLRSKYHLEPQKITEETVFILPKGKFSLVESEAIIASEEDRENCARLELNGPLDVLTQQQLQNVHPQETTVIHSDGKVVSKAHIHALSRHYAQIGGVITLPAYRRKGLGRQCVSALCAHCFALGVESVILFTADTNIPAQGLYKSLGFEPVDAFVIAEYPSP